ncbi:LuxR C-terminal-related transcriptional regulator [Streptomyces sp. NPDC052109]|uniref:helix-turn-helix transcriptional regulator n=1 Tax=Streptomyces sp. NPDC052109 TaxID=3155527 RepID=UPI003435AE3D
MLKLLGLDATAEIVYRTMLTNHRWGIRELTQHLGMSEQTLREALDRLADLKLLIESAGPGVVIPVSPRIGLQSLLRRQEEELRRHQEEFERCQAAIATVFDEYDALYHAGSRCAVEELVGMEAIQSRIRDLAGRATNECLTFNPGGAQSAESLEASKPLDQAVISRGVNMRTVYLDSVRNDAVSTDYAAWLTSLGGQVRTVPALPLRMLVIDRSVALVPVNPENTREGAIQITNPGVMAALVALFESVWDRATPLGACPERDDQGLTRQERELLRLLADGSTDASAASRLGLSLRTVRRMMAELMDRLGARGRFAAGLEAGRRGWV